MLCIPRFCSRNVGNSIKCEKNITPPPPTFEIQNQNKGIEDIMDIESNCPYLLPVFGETTSHLTSKLNVMERRGVSIFFNVENSIKREILKKIYFKILFFSIFKKFIKNSNNIPSISKTIQHTPMTWCTYLQSFEKIHQCVFELVRKLNVTDRRTDGRTDRQTDGGRCNIISPVPGLRRRGR